jgi:hypothetical protein
MHSPESVKYAHKQRTTPGTFRPSQTFSPLFLEDPPLITMKKVEFCRADARQRGW